jgi:hypothetical protein
MTPNADFVRHGEPPGCGKWNCVLCNALPQTADSERAICKHPTVGAVWKRRRLMRVCADCGAELGYLAGWLPPSPNDSSGSPHNHTYPQDEMT